MTVLRLLLLAAAVLGALVRPWRLPPFVAPVVCAIVALAAGATSLQGAGHALRPLAAPLAFLAVALPLAALLDELGYFEQLASLFGRGPKLYGGLWLLSSLTVALLNLDVAVVLLTPLYLSIARRVDASPYYLGLQPVVLALLASSFLPVSNLTNLIAASHDPGAARPVAFLAHLGLPGLAACAVGYACYRFSHRRLEEEETGLRRGGAGLAPGPAPGPGLVPGPARGGARAAGGASEARDRRTIVLGSTLVALVVAGFVAGPSFHVAEWEVALGADLVMMVFARRLPLRAVPLQTILLVAGLGVLAAAAVQDLPLSSLFGGSGILAELRISAAAAAGANIVNNLPALLVSLPFVAHRHGSSCGLWPLLAGVNMGPSLVVTGSLASLLWVESMRRMGVAVDALGYLRLGLRVGAPAYAAGLGVLLLISPAFGCG
ncbi:MAG: SLC13 family permease [Acidimicrobiales bacterium]